MSGPRFVHVSQHDAGAGPLLDELAYLTTGDRQPEAERRSGTTGYLRPAGSLRAEGDEVYPVAFYAGLP